MELNTVVGSLALGLGVLCILMSLVIAAREYVWPIRPALGMGFNPVDILKILVDLLKAILKAPPALAFLVVGLVLFVGGAWVLAAKPI